MGGRLADDAGVKHSGYDFIVFVKSSTLQLDQRDFSFSLLAARSIMPPTFVHGFPVESKRGVIAASLPLKSWLIPTLCPISWAKV